MRITLQLFGAFRPFGEELLLLLPKGAIVSDIRKALINKISEQNSSVNKQGLVDSSRFATETQIMAENQPLQDGATITIIPPVAGG